MRRASRRGAVSGAGAAGWGEEGRRPGFADAAEVVSAASHRRRAWPEVATTSAMLSVGRDACRARESGWPCGGAGAWGANASFGCAARSGGETMAVTRDAAASPPDRGLTPELSRAAKRRRLGRIVRPSLNWPETVSNPARQSERREKRDLEPGQRAAGVWDVTEGVSAAGHRRRLLPEVLVASAM